MTTTDAHAHAAVVASLQKPERLWTRAEVLANPSPVPAEPGICGRHFTVAPSSDLDANQLLYVGIAPRHMRTGSSKQNLHTRVRYHFRGTAEGSTLRLILGCLLGLELRRVGSGRAITFGPAGEAALNEWMHEYARVCWHVCNEPWDVKAVAITRTDLPLNLDQNRDHPFHEQLSALRTAARDRARRLPILT